MINDTVNGLTFDEPELLPFWKAAEQLGAVIFVHQQGGHTLVTPRTTRYHLVNTIGNLVDRAVTFASLVFGGVMDPMPRPQSLSGPRWRLYLFWHRAYGPRLAGTLRGASAYPATTQHLRQTLLL